MGASYFAVSATQDFFKTWGVHHWPSSIPTQQLLSGGSCENCEVILVLSGNLETDKTAMLWQKLPRERHTLSPARWIFGRSIKDPISMAPSRYQCNPMTLAATPLLYRKLSFRFNTCRLSLDWSSTLNTCSLWKSTLMFEYRTKLDQIQGAEIKLARCLRCDSRTKYVVRINGSGRVTLRNRKFLLWYVLVIHTSFPRTIWGRP